MGIVVSLSTSANVSVSTTTALVSSVEVVMSLVETTSTFAVPASLLANATPVGNVNDPAKISAKELFAKTFFIIFSTSSIFD